jgi:ribonuclease HI
MKKNESKYDGVIKAISAALAKIKLQIPKIIALSNSKVVIQAIVIRRETQRHWSVKGC